MTYQVTEFIIHGKPNSTLKFGYVIRSISILYYGNESGFHLIINYISYFVLYLSLFSSKLLDMIIEIHDSNSNLVAVKLVFKSGGSLDKLKKFIFAIQLHLEDTK